MIKAAFFDVDGTLFSHTLRAVPDSARQSLKELKKRGIKIFICTGRHIDELLKFLVVDIEFDGYITLNGQLGLDEQHRKIFSKPLPQDATDDLVTMFQEKNYPLLLVEEEHIYINYVDDLVRKVQEDISSKVPEVLAYDGAPVYQACMYIRRSEEDKIQDKIPSACKIARWNEGGIDIISTTGGKMEGIKQFLKHYNLSQEEIISFGDADNDLDMLEFSHIGVAMGNATDAVKQVADYVTDDIDQDGIAKALQHFGVLA